MDSRDKLETLIGTCNVWSGQTKWVDINGGDAANETMLFEYERRKETDPTFALTLDEFAVLWRARVKMQKATSNDKNHVLKK